MPNFERQGNPSEDRRSIEEGGEYYKEHAIGSREEHSDRLSRERVLESNRIENSRALGGGSNVVKFVCIEGDGNGVFKPASGERCGTSKLGTGYKRERAAYLVDAFLGFNLVPPTVIRATPKDGEGSMQEYIPGGSPGDLLHRSQKQDNPEFMRQAGRMAFFDALINNEDRHGGNFLADKDGKLWAIDNGSTFSRSPHISFYMHGLNISSRSFKLDEEAAQKLKDLALDGSKKELLLKLLSELLDKRECALFFKRLELLAENIVDGCISEDASREIAHRLARFSEAYDAEIRRAITESLSKEAEARLRLIKRLIKDGESGLVVGNLRRFDELDQDIAIRLIEEGYGFSVVKNLDRFQGLDHQKIADKLLERGESMLARKILDKFRLNE